MIVESHTRSIIKSITWRLTATATTIILVDIFTGQLDVALTVGGLELVLKMFLYYLHERGWGQLKYGIREAKPAVFWFTGLSGSGKSTVAQEFYKQLKEAGLKVEYFDGDQIRSIFPQTGFNHDSRKEHVRRVGYLASILEKNGIFVVCSLISPYKDARLFVRDLCKNFVEIYVSTPLEVCEQRDIKGLYAKARRGEIANFTGIDHPYEAPENPELNIDTTSVPLDDAVSKVFEFANKELLSKW
jgi:adenylylsulfate kinase